VAPACTDVRSGRKAPLDGLDRHARGDGHDELIAPHQVADFRQHLVDGLGLHGEHDDVALAHEGTVVARRPDAAKLVKVLQPLPLRVARQDALRREHLSTQEPVDDGAGHVAGTQES